MNNFDILLFLLSEKEGYKITHKQRKRTLIRLFLVSVLSTFAILIAMIIIAGVIK